MLNAHWWIQEFEKGGHMVSAEREPIMGVGEALSPVRSGVMSLVSWVRGLEAERIYIKMVEFCDENSTYILFYH